MLRKSFVPRCHCTKPCNCITDNNKNIINTYIEPERKFKGIFDHRSTPNSSSSKSLYSTPEDSYTEWRQIYERSSSQLSNYYTKAEDLQFEDLPANFMTINDQELVALREFRLQNSNECFSKDSITPLVQKIERQNHTCEYNYKFNERGLLEPKLQTSDGRDICRICKKASELQTTFKVGLGKKSIPIIPGLRGGRGKIVIDDDRAKELGKNYLPKSRFSLNHKRRNNM